MANCYSNFKRRGKINGSFVAIGIRFAIVEYDGGRVLDEMIECRKWEAVYKVVCKDDCGNFWSKKAC